MSEELTVDQKRQEIADFFKDAFAAEEVKLYEVNKPLEVQAVITIKTSDRGTFSLAFLKDIIQ